MGSDGAPPGTKGRDRVGEQGTPKGQTNDSKVYTDSGPRERLKAEIVAGDRSGRRGQRSARTAKLLSRAYDEAGGGDTTEERTETPGHLVGRTDAE